MGYLNEQQLNTLRLFGYLKLPGFIGQEIEAITEAFDASFANYQQEVVSWNNVVHHHRPRQIMPQMADKCDQIRRLLKKPELVNLVTQVLGDDYKFIGSDANIYDCGTRWHTDIIGLPYNCQNIKLICYLDASEKNKDCFRVIPGSHFHTDQFAKRLKQNIREPQQTLKLEIKDIPCQQIPSQPGDAILFDARVWHAVDYAGNRRRAFSFLFGDSNYQPPETGNTHPVQHYE